MDSQEIVTQFVNDCPPAPVVLFTGAGASRPLDFPTTAEFFQDHFQLQSHGFHPKSEHFSSRTAGLFTAVVETLWPDSEKKKLFFDVEAVIKFLHWFTANAPNENSDLLQAYDVIRAVLTDSMNLVQVSQARSGRIKTMQSQDLLGRATQLADELKYAVYANYRSDDNVGDKATKLYVPLAQALGFSIRNSVGGMQRYALPIFTTNYDRSLDVMLEVGERREQVAEAMDVPSVSQIDGFDQDFVRHGHEYFWDRNHYIKQWQELEVVTEGVVLPYFKLHGPLGWRERD
ncbi:MAG: hypothetical protein KAW89_07270, partial [Armatimonadetes bacterium]|nr:hypothetical protein [Armatimonadota bacterium]